MLFLLLCNLLIKPIQQSAITNTDESPLVINNTTPSKAELFKSMRFTRLNENIFICTLEFYRMSEIKLFKLIHISKVNGKNVYSKIPITAKCRKTRGNRMGIKIKLDFNTIKYRGVFVLLIYPHWAKPSFFSTKCFRFIGTKHKIYTCEKQK